MISVPVCTIYATDFFFRNQLSTRRDRCSRDLELSPPWIVQNPDRGPLCYFTAAAGTDRNTQGRPPNSQTGICPLQGHVSHTSTPPGLTMQTAKQQYTPPQRHTLARAIPNLTFSLCPESQRILVVRGGVGERWRFHIFSSLSRIRYWHVFDMAVLIQTTRLPDISNSACDRSSQWDRGSSHTAQAMPWRPRRDQSQRLPMTPRPPRRGSHAPRPDARAPDQAYI